MKIAIFAPYKRVAPHFETELELAQRHIDSGDQVEYISCTGELSNCDFNVEKDRQSCMECSLRQNAGLKLLSGKIKTRSFTGSGDPMPAKIPAFKSIDQLKHYEIGGFDIGYACMSSLVSKVRDPIPDLQLHKAVLDRLINSAWTTFSSTRRYLSQFKPDQAYVFNGRFSSMRAILRACQVEGVPCAIHERGFDKNHYQLYLNELPHDIDYMQSRFEENWQAAVSEDVRMHLGAKWFEDRRKCIETNWKSFVKNQTTGRLPENFDKARRNIAIFISSEDEFVAISDSWCHPIYSDQVTGIRLILNALGDRDDVHFYVRVHPNLAGLNNSQTQALKSLAGDSLTVIPAESPVDTYQLLLSCEKTVSFGSSVGIEACYWQRPSIMLGASLYRGMGGTYEPQTHSEAIDLIDRHLEPLPQTPALKYGYWFQTHGIPFKYFVAADLFSGTFKGTNVYPEPKLGFSRRLEKSFRNLLIKLNLKRTKAA
jgi:hypothetical protein